MLMGRKLLPAVLVVAAVGVATPACASQIYGNSGGSYRQVERRAYDNGYREGLRGGDADQGYRRNEGDRDQYRRSFRQGYQTGYNEAFSRYGNRNSRGGVYPANP